MSKLKQNVSKNLKLIIYVKQGKDLFNAVYFFEDYDDFHKKFPNIIKQYNPYDFRLYKYAGQSEMNLEEVQI